MKKKVTKTSPKSIWYFTAEEDMGNPAVGDFPAWFEAYITSNKADEALAQNTGLSFAEEADWTPESFKESGAIDDLLRSAANTVKGMDGIGFWVNNQQDNMRFGVPPHTRQEMLEQANVNEQVRYW
ncbi:hypothetical protein BKA67DRAFT_547462 [Truncatella angustata]|uniref:Uncharacterized protein n=1 Tax=Truncatella angustata TaxID=152316 RepID=A0A9P8UVY2_9PEZI|nr:uncharacterized protein BKA67DRAFT_547462 [Truncatella angustata]KAH6660264.1 hypothetical protein BKA67DRAFT_547462 [Truncatella angustata]